MAPNFSAWLSPIEPLSLSRTEEEMAFEKILGLIVNHTKGDDLLTSIQTIFKKIQIPDQLLTRTISASIEKQLPTLASWLCTYIRDSSTATSMKRIIAKEIQRRPSLPAPNLINRR